VKGSNYSWRSTLADLAVPGQPSNVNPEQAFLPRLFHDSIEALAILQLRHLSERHTLGTYLSTSFHL
jgi:hypothetical protein